MNVDWNDVDGVMRPLARCTFAAIGVGYFTGIAVTAYRQTRQDLGEVFA